TVAVGLGSDRAADCRAGQPAHAGPDQRATKPLAIGDAIAGYAARDRSENPADGGAAAAAAGVFVIGAALLDPARALIFGIAHRRPRGTKPAFPIAATSIPFGAIFIGGLGVFIPVPIPVLV